MFSIIPGSKSLLLLTLLAASTTLAQQCYFPDGMTVSPQDVPCNSSAAASPCCNSAIMCLDNGLCLLNGVMSRGSCTDKNWGPGCPGYCESQALDHGISLFPCSEIGNQWSCSWGNCDENNVLDIPGGAAVVLRANQVKPLGGDSAIVISAADVLHVTSSNATAPGSPVESSAIPVAKNSTAESSSAVPSTQSGDKAFSAADMAGLGVGLGVPLALALGFIGFLLLQRKKMQQRVGSLGAPQTSSSAAAAGGMKQQDQGVSAAWQQQQQQQQQQGYASQQHSPAPQYSNPVPLKAGGYAPIYPQPLGVGELDGGPRDRQELGE